MLQFARHNLRVLLRLAAMFVLLGLGTVPVECAAVYGPHSIFISADAVAQIQHSGHQHAQSLAPAEAGMAAMEMPDKVSATHPPGLPVTGPSRAGVSSSLPVPAGTAVDALIAVAILESDGTPGPRDFLTISRLFPLPAGNLQPAPEPPPPQYGS